MGCAFVQFFCSFSLICTVHLALRTCNFCAKVVLCALSIFIHSCIPISLMGCSSYCVTITLESGLAQDAVPPDCLTRHCSWKIQGNSRPSMLCVCNGLSKLRLVTFLCFCSLIIMVFLPQCSLGPRL